MCPSWGGNTDQVDPCVPAGWRAITGQFSTAADPVTA